MKKAALNTLAKAMPAEQPEAVAKLLDSMMGLCGGLDRTIIDECGQPFPFVLLVFTGSGAVHVTNGPPAQMINAVVAFANEVKQAGGSDAAG